MVQVNTEARAWLQDHQGLLRRVGNTPLLPLRADRFGVGPGVELLAKAEWYNPSGSVKDRPAAGILQAALDSGALSDGRVLLDSTSGNMGIAYATLAAPLRVRVHLAIPANASRSRLEILRALGAELTLTDPSEGTDGARQVAAKLAADRPDLFFFADQYSNPANWQAHYQTTGPELMEGTGRRLTHLVIGLGTTGTMTGAGRFLREQMPEVRLIAMQPGSPLHGLEGLKHLDSSMTPDIYDPLVPDETVFVSTEDSYEMARRLAREEGLVVGVSAAAAAAAAVEVARRIDHGTVVTLFPDSGIKYLDQPFWRAP